MIKSNPTILVLVAWIALLVPAAHAAEKDTVPTPPNIVFIMADDLGYGELGCYGQQIIKTPRIDQLASEGLRFTQITTRARPSAPLRAAR